MVNASRFASDRLACALSQVTAFALHFSATMASEFRAQNRESPLYTKNEAHKSACASERDGSRLKVNGGWLLEMAGEINEETFHVHINNKV